MCSQGNKPHGGISSNSRVTGPKRLLRSWYQDCNTWVSNGNISSRERSHIPRLEKEKHWLKSALGGDIFVPWRVPSYKPCSMFGLKVFSLFVFKMSKHPFDCWWFDSAHTFQPLWQLPSIQELVVTRPKIMDWLKMTVVTSVTLHRQVITWYVHDNSIYINIVELYTVRV